MRILSRLQTGAVVAGLAALELQPAAHDEGALQGRCPESRS